MNGMEIRIAREEAKLGQVAFASLCGIARSGLQHLEATGNASIATLERVIANLPNLRTITLGGREFVAVDLAAAQRTAGRLADDVRELTEILGAPSPLSRRDTGPVGATRHEPSGVDEETLRRLREIEAELRRNGPAKEHDS